MRWLWKLLYPGLGIKRWLLVFVAGLLLIMAGLLPWLMGMPRVARLARNALFDLYSLGARPAYLLALFGLGLVLTVWAGIRLLRSFTADLVPHNSDKMVDVLYQIRSRRRGPRIVVLGGGTGLAMLLRGLKEYTSNITAVVTVADDGGSSGVLRGELNMPPPGDIRNCLVALADTEPLLAQLLQYRFDQGSGLKGHSFGNLFLAAMTEMMGFQQAVKQFGKVLAIRGKVLPVTGDIIQLKATTADGEVLWGESNIGRSGKPIAKLELEPAHCQALPEVLNDIELADAIVVGPGSLYTSLLPNLLVGGIGEAILASKALKFYICNIMTQWGETRGYTVGDHLQALLDHVGHNLFDYCIVNTQPVAPTVVERYSLEGGEQVKLDIARLRRFPVRVLAQALLHTGTAHHDSRALARLVLSRVVAESTRPSRWLDLLLLEGQLSKDGVRRNEKA